MIVTRSGCEFTVVSTARKFLVMVRGKGNSLLRVAVNIVGGMGNGSRGAHTNAGTLTLGE